MTKMKYKNFQSPDGETKRLVYDGQVALVDGKWQNIGEIFWREAYAQGCISKDMIAGRVPKNIDIKTIEALSKIAVRDEEIKGIIKGWVESNELNKFDKNGKPKATELTTVMGFRIPAQVRDKCWYELQQELKA